MQQPEEKTRVILGGLLGRKFGRIWYLYVKSPAEAIRLIAANCPGFREEMQRQVDSGVNYGVRVDYKNRGEKELDFPAGKNLLIMPILQGAKKGGVFQTILGIIIIIVGVILAVYQQPYAASVIAAGAAMTVGGIVTMLSPMPRLADTSSQGGDAVKSYYFNGATSNEDQNTPVPVIYGTMMVGSRPISGSMVVS